MALLPLLLRRHRLHSSLRHPQPGAPPPSHRLSQEILLGYLHGCSLGDSRLHLPAASRARSAQQDICPMLEYSDHSGAAMGQCVCVHVDGTHGVLLAAREETVEDQGKDADGVVCVA